MSTTTSCRIVQIPGPQGDAGADGADGTNGYNAYSLVAAQFAVPASGATVLVTLTDPPGNRWMQPTQVVAIQGAGTGSTRSGYYEVVSLTGTTQVTLLNLRNNATGVYADNIDGAGETIAANMKISPAGQQGPAGSLTGVAGGDLQGNYPNPTLVDTGTAGTSGDATHVAQVTTDAQGRVTNLADVAITFPNLAALGGVPTGLATASGLTTSATDKVLGRSSAGAGAVEEIPCTTSARAFLAAASAQAERQAMGRVGMRYGLLGYVTAMNLNSVADTSITMESSRYIIDKVTMENASVNLTTAQAGLFTAAGGAGTVLAAGQVLTALSASTKLLQLTLEAVVGTDVCTAATLYARNTVAQGVAATANLWIWGWDIA